MKQLFFEISGSIFFSVFIFGLFKLIDKIILPEKENSPVQRLLYKITFTEYDISKNGGKAFIVIIKLAVISFIIYSISYLLVIAGAVFLFIKNRKGKNVMQIKKETDNIYSEGFEFVYQEIGKEQKLILQNPYRGNLIIGGAGSGKSKSIIYPLIQQAGEKDFTGILYDFKFPELTEALVAAYDNKNIRIHTISLADARYSDRVNPIKPETLLNSAYAREFASTIIANLNPDSIKKRDFWVQSSEAILTSVIWYLKCEFPEYCTMAHVISLILYANPSDLIQILQQNEEVKGLISSVADGLKSDNQTAGVFATIKNSLAMLNRPEIFWILSGNDFELDLNNPNKKSFLCIANDPSLTESISPLVSLIIISALKKMNQPNKAPSIILLDEAPTLYIPNFEQIPATGRSNKIATVFCAQDIAQMEDKYGTTKAETILSNLGNQFYGRTTNPKTAERIIKLFGKHDVEYQSTSVSKSNGGGLLGTTSKTQSKSMQLRDRIDMGQILSLKSGNFYTVLAESNKGFYSDAMRFKEVSCTTFHLKPKEINQEEITANYQRIRGECMWLFEREENTPVENPNPFL